MNRADRFIRSNWKISIYLLLAMLSDGKNWKISAFSNVHYLYPLYLWSSDGNNLFVLSFVPENDPCGVGEAILVRT